MNVTVFERASDDLSGRGTGLGTRDELFDVMRRIGIGIDGSIAVDFTPASLSITTERPYVKSRSATRPPRGTASIGRSRARSLPNATTSACSSND